MRRDILNAARELMSREGLDGISIRKIAAMIEYSPTIIYHYFTNKDEIIETLLEEDYRKLLSALEGLQSGEGTPEEKLKECAKRYILLAVQMGASYRNIMLNDSPAVLAHTSVLSKGAGAQRPGVAMLCKALRELPELARAEDENLELTAQTVWSTAFGLAIRLSVEHVEERQQQRLIDYAADFILTALKSSRSGETAASS